MKKTQWLAILMTVAILGVTGFQLYWLKQNYTREAKSLELKTDAFFKETILQLQVSKLKLDGIKWTSEEGKPAVRVIMDNNKEGVRVKVSPKEEIVSTVNIIGDKLRDSLRKTGKNKMVISLNKTTIDFKTDSIKLHKTLPGLPPGRDYVFNLLYGVDSLQDSLRIQEIDSAYSQRLSEERLSIPFSIHRLDSAQAESHNGFRQVTIGLVKPVTYRLELGNTFPYLLRQLIQPILFSVLLLGITILTFVLLYRNMLKQRRLADLKNEFISNITHELKTPIATVGVAIEALKNFNAMDNPQRTREYLDISGNELQRLSLLVDKVLKLSMFEKKEVELKYEMLNLHELVKEVVSSLKLQAEKYHAEISISQEGDVTINGDRLHLLSVIFNLVDNALKYSRENPRISIALKETAEHVEMRIMDNGIGIAPEYRDKVFEKFFRVPHGDTHNAKGYGLGLSYAAQVIKKHSGHIQAHSHDGSGTTFIITLPKNISA